MGPGVIAQRQLQHVLEEQGPHCLIAAVGKPICVQGNQCAADNDEQPKTDPGADQGSQMVPRKLRNPPLGIGQGVDNASKKNGLDERGCSKRQVGNREEPAQARFAPEQFKHAQIESKEFHRSSLRSLSGGRKAESNTSSGFGLALKWKVSPI